MRDPTTEAPMTDLSDRIHAPVECATVGAVSQEDDRAWCETCDGTGKIVEAARYTGANTHSACQMDCEDCDGEGRR